MKAVPIKPIAMCISSRKSDDHKTWDGMIAMTIPIPQLIGIDTCLLRSRVIDAGIRLPMNAERSNIPKLLLIEYRECEGVLRANRKACKFDIFLARTPSGGSRKNYSCDL